jgi:hypothetical protein
MKKIFGGAVGHDTDPRARLRLGGDQNVFDKHLVATSKWEL